MERKLFEELTILDWFGKPSPIDLLQPARPTHSISSLSQDDFRGIRKTHALFAMVTERCRHLCSTFARSPYDFAAQPIASILAG